MRQPKSAKQVQTPKSVQPVKNTSGRQEMNRFLRSLLVLVLLFLFAAIVFAGYASLFPVSFPLNTPVLGYQRDCAIDYEVILKPNSFTDQQSVGMDQIYIRDFVESVQAHFDYQYHADRTSNMKYSYTINATVRVHDDKNPDKILLTREINLLPETVGQINGKDLAITDDVSLDLAVYDAIVDQFKTLSNQPATFDMAVTLQVIVTSNLPTGPAQVTDTAVMQIPLKQPQFEITNKLPGQQTVFVEQMVLNKLVLANIPFVIFPVMASLCLLLLILLLTLTRGRRKNRFNLQLRRMMRLAKNRLMVIGDKAWEPEWCVTATDYRSMVRTAKKLKHPVFCYVDRQAPTPTAYFYIYYGENNYCYTFASDAVLPADTDFDGGTLGSLVTDLPDKSDQPEPMEPDDRIPLLPETDDSNDLFLSKLMTQKDYYQR